MFVMNQKLVKGDRVVITGGNHIRHVGTVIAKVLPRSYHVIFDVREKPGEKSSSCIRSWNVKKEPTNIKKSTASPYTTTSPPYTMTSVDLPKWEKKWVKTISLEAITQVMLPVLKGMSSLTKRGDNLFD